MARHARQGVEMERGHELDEIVGHYFVYPIYIDLVADDSEKPALRAVIDRITNHILDNKTSWSISTGSARAGDGGRQS